MYLHTRCLMYIYRPVPPRFAARTCSGSVKPAHRLSVAWQACLHFAIIDKPFFGFVSKEKIGCSARLGTAGLCSWQHKIRPSLKTKLIHFSVFLQQKEWILPWPWLLVSIYFYIGSWKSPVSTTNLTCLHYSRCKRGEAVTTTLAELSIIS